MKRTIWSSIAVIVLTAAVVVPVIAQPLQGWGGRGPGRGGPRAPGAPGPILRELNLTDAQREQVRSLAEQRRGQGDDPRRKVADLERQLQLAVFADAPNQQKVDELRNAVAAARAEELAARIELRTRIAEILTPEQRARAREALANRGGPRGPAPGGRRGRARV